MFFIIYKKSKTGDLKAIFLSMDKKYLLLAGIFFLAFRLMEAISLYILFNRVNQKTKFKNCINYSILGYFFSQLTPSGGGGQPAQLYLMAKDQIKMDKALSVIVPFNIMYHASMSLLALLSLTTSLRYIILDTGLKGFFYLGIGLQIAMALVAILAFKKADFLVKILSRILEKISKISFLKRFYRTEDDIRAYIEKIRENMAGLAENKINFLIIFLLQAMMVFFYYGLAFFSYRALGFNNYGIFDIVRIQCLITVATEYIPTPGTAGFSEFTMYQAYKNIIKKDMALGRMMVNRLLMLYLALFISLLIIYKKKILIIKE